MNLTQIAFLLINLLSNTAFAGDLQNGCTFSPVLESHGLPAYRVTSTDNAGQVHTVSWLRQAEPGQFYNYLAQVVTAGPGALADSAISGCAAKGLELPTQAEFEALLNCFLPAQPTPRDVQNFYDRFEGFGQGRPFWSSTAGPSGPIQGYALFTYDDVPLLDINSTEEGAGHFSIICLDRD